MLLRSGGALSGEVAYSLPDVNTVISGAPSGGHYFSWQVIYDRTDVFDPQLESYFASQPWTGNGTKDVVLTIVEVPDEHPLNHAPVATGDSYVTYMDQALFVGSPGVLANDSDPDQDLISAVLQSGPSFGALSLAADGSFTYTPSAGYVGGDSFTYRASDGALLSNLATVTIDVLPIGGGGGGGEVCPDGPEAIDDWWAAVPTAFGNVLDNDVCGYQGQIEETVTLVSGPAHAISFELQPNGDFNYVMDDQYVGYDYFSYQFTVNGQTSNVGTVTLESMAEPLLLDLPPATVVSTSPAITQADLDRLAREAARRWILAGVDPISVHRAFHGTTLAIADLEGSRLGEHLGNTITIDVNAAGYGWFVDPTPRSDHEFSILVSVSERQAAEGSAAYGRADLLTALMHEFGHALGMAHLEGDEFAHSVMNDTLGLSMRRNPTAADILATDEYFAGLWEAGSTIRRRRW
jgi:hypothetical protein